VHPDRVNADNCDLTSMVPVLLACLIDRNVEVRKLSQSCLIVITSTVSAHIIRSKAADLYRGAQYSSIAPYLDGLGFNSVDSPSSNAKPVESKSRAHSSQTTKQSRITTVAEKKEVLADLAPVLEASNQALLTNDPRTKDHRALADKGILKWVFDSPRKELVDLLYNQCEGNFGAETRELLFSDNHYKEKDFMSGLKQVDGFIKGEDISLSRGEILKRVVANGDLILRYLTLRFLDTNTSIFIKCLELLEGFFEALDEASYLMSEFEASSFLPFFVNKVLR
jgi:cytoskeleton-associated protein 5